MPRILAFSDLHLDRGAAQTIIAAATEADLVIGAGDFASGKQGLDGFMPLFAPIAGKCLFVHGNNEELSALRAVTGAEVLHGAVTSRAGLRIAGLGCAVPPLPKIPWGSVDMTEDEAAEVLAGITEADILISHSPPHGVADYHAGRGEHIGSASVRAAAERLAPRYLLCGHVHDCWGQRGLIGATQVINLGPTPTMIEL